MEKSTLFLVCFCLLFSCQENTQEATDTSKEVTNYTLEQLLDNNDIYRVAFSHDEKEILLGSNETGIFNAYMINIESGERRPLTQSTDETISPVSLFPNDNRMLYLADKGGNEVFHIYLRNEDGTIEDLTPVEGAIADFYGWADDLKSFFYSYNARDNKYMDVFEMDIATFQSKMLYKNEEGYDLAAISNDKKYIVSIKSVNFNDSDLFLTDTKTGKRIKVNKGLSGNSVADFSVDSKALFYLTDEGSEFTYLMRYDIESGEREKVLEENWDISYAYFSKTGKYRVVEINQDATGKVKIFDMQTGQQIDFPELSAGEVYNVKISRSEDKMIISAMSSIFPINTYVYDFKTKIAKELIQTLNEAINPSDLVEAEVVRYKSFDGLEIPAIFYKPHQASKEHKVPALVWVHGGPGGQSTTDNFNHVIQFLVNQGYAILAVNNRGSSGYGKTFIQMDDQNHGEKDLQDCIEGKKYLAGLPYIDKDKIGIFGLSYGGFMVMRAMTHTPEEFKVGVNLFGVTNWLRTLRNLPPSWTSYKESFFQEMGDPNTADSIRLYEISPVFHGAKVKHPVIVLQGAMDMRVPQSESDNMVAAMKDNNIPVEYVLFEDEGHGFVKKKNQIEGYNKVLEFLDKYLKEGIKE